MGNLDFVIKNGMQVNGAVLIVNSTSKRVGINNAAPVVSFHITANDAVLFPVGNTGQRPTGANGYFRYNTDLNNFEGFIGGSWGSIGGGANLAGSNTQIQYNNSGNPGASANLTFDQSTQTFATVNFSTPSATIDAVHKTGNASAASITISSTTGGVSISGNSTVQPFTADGSGISIKKQRSQTVTFAATSIFDCANGNIMTLTLTANTIMGQPTNIQPGFYTLYLKQDATGSRVVTSWNAVFKWSGGVAPQLTGTASATDIVSFVSDGTNFFGTFVPDVK